MRLASDAHHRDQQRDRYRQSSGCPVKDQQQQEIANRQDGSGIESTSTQSNLHDPNIQSYHRGSGKHEKVVGSSTGSGSGSDPVRIKVSSTSNWTRSMDRWLFASDGCAKFRRGSTDDDAFKEFFERYQARLTEMGQSTPTSEYELRERLHKAVVLYENFQAKKKEALKKKIEGGMDSQANLPISAFEKQIVLAIKENPVILIAADTGAGKSTQIPQFLMTAGFLRIACTQPRRIACYSLARRVSYETMNCYGSKIAYQVRFENTSNSDTRIVFLTEGVLLRQYAADPTLQQYDVIIVDEVHERHASGDFLLGVLKLLVRQRPSLRVVLMSATINISLISGYFNAPVIEIPGRMFPVTIEYVPAEKEDPNLSSVKLYRERQGASTVASIPAKSSKINPEPYLRIIERIDRLVPIEERGDILIFVSGISEISTLSDELTSYAESTGRWIVLPLHSTLSVADQEKVFYIAPPGVRKCIISTNIAETSVTIDGIRFVIDSGKVKEMGCDSSTGHLRLQECWISKSSAKQRTGRAGRTGPGECYRLYSKIEYEHMNDFPVPEILRTSLEPILLQTLALELGNPLGFDFLERPSEDVLSTSMERLQCLHTIDEQLSITTLGRVLSFLPVDVTIGRMLILGSTSHVMTPMIIIAASLSAQSPFIRISESNIGVTENRKKLHSTEGDAFTLLNLFSEWLKAKADHRMSSRSWCRRYGVEEQRLYEIVKLKDQFEKILGGMKFLVQDRVKDRRMALDHLKDEDWHLRKEHRKQLNKRKRESASTTRKVLQLDSKVDVQDINDTEMDVGETDGNTKDDDLLPASIQDLEFLLKHNASSLSSTSDVGLLTGRDIQILKLIISSGLYPKIAVPDESNNSRPITEQVFHTRNRRFVSMHPTSVYYLCPELVQVQQRAPDTRQNSIPSKPNHDSLHARTTFHDLLLFVDLLETTKPYLVNTIRVNALPVCLLFALSIDISANLMHLVVDNWLHIEFEDQETAQRILVLGNWLRLAWQIVTDKQLSQIPKSLRMHNQRLHNPINRPKDKMPISQISGDQNSSNLQQPPVSLSFVPDAIAKMRTDWKDFQSWTPGGQFSLVESQEVIDKLLILIDADTKFYCSRFKMQDSHRLFGYDPYQGDTLEKAAFHATPVFRYFVPDPGRVLKEHHHQMRLPEIQRIFPEWPEGALSDTNRQPANTYAATRRDFQCSSCGQTLFLSTVEIFRHRKSCPN
ncbi:hypothetical protein BASA62_005429 [Batrachochytrium salamandrivorans]|nr:hypothetical protein BASA62_005429 [Batrachochytrium salamandrivorans]